MNPSQAKPDGKTLRTLTQEQADIIGEVSNISMGSAATALSSIMGKKVTITSPRVEMGDSRTLEAIQRIPSVDVVVSYTEGISGRNILVIRQSDAVEIVNAMTGGAMEDEQGFGELHVSAIAEVMNQMMGSAATALSGFIGRPVNISPPDAFILTEENREAKLAFLRQEQELVLVRFLFKVENTLESNLYMVMVPEFAAELVDIMLGQMGTAEEDAPAGSGSAAEKAPAPDPKAGPLPAAGQPPSPPAAAPASAPVSAPVPPERRAAVSQAAAAAQPAAVPMPRTVVRPAVLPRFDLPPAPLTPDESANFQLIQDVPLELSVEVGRARRKVREVIDFSVGSIIELDKQAGDPVDIIVNGQLIAHGEVVVIDESFGVRVTEIVSRPDSGGK